MMIHFACPKCGKDFQVKDEFSGRQTRCRNCGQSLTVPASYPPLAALAPPSPSVYPGASGDSDLSLMAASFIQHNLMPGERLVATTQIHPRAVLAQSFVTGCGLFLTWILVFVAGGGLGLVTVGVPAAIMAGGGILLLWIKRLTTEFSCTNRRILIKSGLATTRLREMPLAKVEALRLEQDLFGKLFGYGTLVFNGSGGTKRTCKNIENPFGFYKRVQEQVAHAQMPK